MKKYFFCLSIIILVSCQSKNAEKNEVIITKPVNKIEIKKNADSLIYKINENSIVAGEDTLKIEAPFIYSFEGKLDGEKKIQIHISNTLSTEYGGYMKMGDLYIDGQDEVFDFAFEEKKEKNFYTSKVEKNYSSENSERTICNLKLYNLSTEEMFIECIYNKKTYKIYPSKNFPAYNCFDQIDYTLFDSRAAFKKEEAMREFTPSRNYDFFAEIISNDATFDALNSNLKYLATDSLSVQNYKKWKHNFIVKKATDENENYRSENLNVTAPFFIDSNVFVASRFSYSYMGGAHGMLSTEYDNYDVSTGKKVTINEIVNIDSEDFIEFYKNRVKSEYGDGVLSMEIPITHNFYILPTGITFSYAPYELLGFAAGQPHLFFNFEELKPYRKKNTIIDKYIVK